MLNTMKQTGTPACIMRDILIEAHASKKIKYKEITVRLYEAGIPMWLQQQIVQMCNFNSYKRITCPVEQAMQDAVYSCILDEISY